MKDKLSFLACALVIFQSALLIGTSAENHEELYFSSNSSVDNARKSLGLWSEMLEDFVVSETRQSRTSKVMKMGDKTLTILSKGSPPNKREVSETDLYLLGAIEKLVHRVDFLENRLRRAEELLYYVISGNINKMKEPCPANYTKHGRGCYHFSNRDFDWKSSASLCRGMGGHLVEFETAEEKKVITTALQTDGKLRGKNYWTGGLNPGLLWIWASSAKPVHQDAKQTVPGDGRCLKLFYSATSKTYSYRGDDCGMRQRYICKLTKDDESLNKIERTVRKLGLEDD